MTSWLLSEKRRIDGAPNLFACLENESDCQCHNLEAVWLVQEYKEAGSALQGDWTKNHTAP